MAINRYRFYLGPPGALTALPPHSRTPNLDATSEVIGALQQALSGRRTLDIRNFKKKWQLEWDFRTEDELSVLLRAFKGYRNLPSRFMDPRSRNLFSLNVSTGGSELQDLTGFTYTPLSGGIATYSPTALANPTELLHQISGGVHIQGVGTNDEISATEEYIPLIDGSTYRFSGYLAGTGTVQPFVTKRNVSGVSTGAVNLGSPIALGAAYTTPFDVSWVATSDPLASFGIRANAGTTTIHTTGWMLQIDETKKAWMPGDGCPEVIVSEFKKKYTARTKTLVYHTLSATILEA
jgi:hypothetical protein